MVNLMLLSIQYFVSSDNSILESKNCIPKSIKKCFSMHNLVSPFLLYSKDNKR